MSDYRIIIVSGRQSKLFKCGREPQCSCSMKIEEPKRIKLIVTLLWVIYIKAISYFDANKSCAT